MGLGGLVAAGQVDAIAELVSQPAGAGLLASLRRGIGPAVEVTSKRGIALAIAAVRSATARLLAGTVVHTEVVTPAGAVKEAPWKEAL